MLLKSLGHNAGALDFSVGCIGSAHAPVLQATNCLQVSSTLAHLLTHVLEVSVLVHLLTHVVLQATIVIPGFGGMMGDVVGRGDAPNKKMAEKMAALDACVKLAQLGRLAHVPKSSSRGGAGGKGSKKAPVYAGDVGPVPLCSSRCC